MSDLAKLFAELSEDMKSGIDVWRVRPGLYTCPGCASHNVAREENRTTRYDETGKLPDSSDVERIIRCMDCGTAGGE